MKCKHIVLALLMFPIFCISPKTFAAGNTAKVSWIAPTSYTDASLLPATDIASYTVKWGPSSGLVGPSGSATVTTNSAVIPVACGSVSFIVSVTTTATALYPNATSASSSAVPYATGIACVPNPPSGITVQ